MFHYKNNFANIVCKCIECLILYLAPEIVFQFEEYYAERERLYVKDNMHCVLRFWDRVEMLWRLKTEKSPSGNAGQGQFSDASGSRSGLERKCLLFICRGVRTLPGWGSSQSQPGRWEDGRTTCQLKPNLFFSLFAFFVFVFFCLFEKSC